MKWGCPSKMLYPSMFGEGGKWRVNEWGSYRGHTLERVTTGEGGDLWTGWRCQWCGERFQLPGEVARYDLPLMEDVETEDLPDDEREGAAIALACAASTEVDVEIVVPIGHYVESVHSGSLALARRGLAYSSRSFGRKWYAEAEALIRTGEVTP